MRTHFHLASLGVVLAACLGWLAGCGDAGSSAEDSASRTRTGPTTLAVAVSIPPQAWLVERLAGDRAAVTTLLRPGDSPHSYTPTDRQVTELMRSDLLLRIGVGFENAPWFGRLSGTRGGPRVVDLREGIELRDMALDNAQSLAAMMDADGHDDHGDTAHHGPDDHGQDEHDHHEHAGHLHDHSHTGADPHIWLTPANLSVMAVTTRDALVSLDPDGRALYDENLASLQQELAALDRELSARLAPLRGRAMYVYHPAWGYFCDAYGLRQIAAEIAGRTPTDAELTALRSLADRDRPAHLYHQPQFAGRNVEVIASILGAELVQLDPLAREVPANLTTLADRLLTDAGPIDPNQHPIRKPDHGQHHDHAQGHGHEQDHERDHATADKDPH